MTVSLIMGLANSQLFKVIVKDKNIDPIVDPTETVVKINDGTKSTETRRALYDVNFGSDLFT